MRARPNAGTAEHPMRTIDREDQDELLAPAEEFSDDPAPEHVRPLYERWYAAPGIDKPICYAFRRTIASNCCGWSAPPSPEELSEAIHAAGEPTIRERLLISMWWNEATDDDLLNAWAERAYTWRELVAAVHRVGGARWYPERNKAVNGFRGKR